MAILFIPFAGPEFYYQPFYTLRFQAGSKKTLCRLGLPDFMIRESPRSAVKSFLEAIAAI